MRWKEATRLISTAKNKEQRPNKDDAHPESICGRQPNEAARRLTSWWATTVATCASVCVRATCVSARVCMREHVRQVTIDRWLLLWDARSHAFFFFFFVVVAARFNKQPTSFLPPAVSSPRLPSPLPSSPETDVFCIQTQELPSGRVLPRSRLAIGRCEKQQPERKTRRGGERSQTLPWGVNKAPCTCTCTAQRRDWPSYGLLWQQTVIDHSAFQPIYF